MKPAFSLYRSGWKFAVLPAMVLLFFSGCTKDKVKDVLPQQASLVNAGSGIRLFNFYNANVDVSVNNIPLTNYGSSQATQLGLAIFPNGYWPNRDDGGAFTIPNSLLDKQGRAHVVVTPQINNPAYQAFNFRGIDTVLQNDLLHPKDYYTLFDGSLQVVPRNAAAPSQPDHFKIRILNLMKSPDQVGFYGPVTLTYADGTVVSPQTSGIYPPDTVGHSGASDYVELPLGAYQFKLFMSMPTGAPDFTRQLAELPARPNFNGFDQTIGGQPAEEAIFPKIRTFKAGATYSMSITKAAVVQPYGSNGNNYFWYESVHAYRIVTEQSAGPNSTYACMDAVNALRLPGVTIRVDGSALGANLSFGQYAGHKVYVWGNHHVQAVDQQGAVLAEKDIQLYPNDYLTAWAYLGPGGKPAIVFSTTDMTSTLYQTNQFGQVTTYDAGNFVSVPDDGTNGSVRVRTSDYNWQSRFLNLSEDAPYVTFGNDDVLQPGYGYAGGDLLFPQHQGSGADSLNFASATINMGQGVTDASQPFVMFPIVSNLFWIGDGTSNANTGFLTPGNHIIAFQSWPGPPAIVPGQLLADVAGIPWRSFIANKSMYSSPAITPTEEPGFYSIALIGNMAQAVNGQGKLIYIKHNQ